MRRMRRLSIGLGLALLFTWAIRGGVLAQESRHPTPPGAWNQCWNTLHQLPVDHVSAAEELLQPEFLVTGYELRASTPAARAIFSGSAGDRISLEELARYDVPLWRAKHVDWSASGATPLSLAHGVNACLPYPVRSVNAVPTSIVRGQTLAVAVETDQWAACRYTVLGQTEPCYWSGERDAFVLVGLSALMEPGRYPLRIEIVSGADQAILSLPLEVTSGNYGFQFINPPEALNQLMNAELMVSEDAFLAQWRVLRSTDRYWDLPLTFPLPQAFPVTAGYGDRRSYGGVVDGYHSGVDYGAPLGTQVLAPADGIVAMVDSLEMRGLSVLIDHGWGLITGYWHLSRADVNVGDRVLRGQPFALVGSTGLSTGPHLHWEVWADGASVDGRQFLTEDALRGVALPPRAPLPEVTSGD